MLPTSAYISSSAHQGRPLHCPPIHPAAAWQCQTMLHHLQTPLVDQGRLQEPPGRARRAGPWRSGEPIGGGCSSSSSSASSPLRLASMDALPTALMQKEPCFKAAPAECRAMQSPLHCERAPQTWILPRPRADTVRYGAKEIVLKKSAGDLGADFLDKIRNRLRFLRFPLGNPQKRVCKLRNQGGRPPDPDF